MTKEEEIKSIEFRLKAIFSQDVVKAIHVIESKELFSKWKVLTGYVSDKTPVLNHTRLEKYSERFDNDKSPIGNPETWGKRVLTEEDIFNQRDIDAVTDYINRETSKQETLEEAAGSCAIKENRSSLYELGMKYFIEGAKWQSERSYSEEEVEDFIYKVCGTVARLQGITLNGNHIDTAYKQFKKK